MMNTVQTKNTETNLSTLKKKIQHDRGDLNSLNQQKEAAFAKKKQLWEDLGPAIKRIKELKRELDTTNDSQNKIKAERDKWNKQCQALVKQAKELQQEKLKVFKKHNIKGNPAILQKTVDRLELKIETEALSLTQEKKVMLKLKELKKQIKEQSVGQDIFKKLRALSTQIDEAKKKGNEAHEKLKAEIKKKSANYKEFIKLSKEIGKHKASHDSAFQQFIEAKKKFTAKNQELKKGLVQVGAAAAKVRHKRDEQRHAKVQQRAQADQKIIAQKGQEVEKKLKQKKKLTTEDLLVFQGQK